MVGLTSAIPGLEAAGWPHNSLILPVGSSRKELEDRIKDLCENGGASLVITPTCRVQYKSFWSGSSIDSTQHTYPFVLAAEGEMPDLRQAAINEKWYVFNMYLRGAQVTVGEDINPVTGEQAWLIGIAQLSWPRPEVLFIFTADRFGHSVLYVARSKPAQFLPNLAVSPSQLIAAGVYPPTDSKI